MIKGTVKFFNNAKGFGFITPDDGGKDVFVPAASITKSGSGRLKAGQRVSFEAEPDPKGPKAVNLKLLDEAPREISARETSVKEVSAEAAQDLSTEAKDEAKAPRPQLTLYHDPGAEDAADVLEALKDAGHEPRLTDVALTPPGREELRRLSILLREADQSLVRRYDPLFLELQLDDRFISENEFWQGIVEHPQLINAPVLATASKARIVRSANDVKSFLGQEVPRDIKPKGLSPRMAALMKGHALPPKSDAKPEPERGANPEIKLPPETKSRKTATAEKKPAKPAAKKAAAAKPVPKAKKAVQKTVRKK